jgi:RNA polymerase sigma-70 factor (ECF subfamily)
VRTATEPYRQTAVKDRMRELRESLPPDDQMLLILRIDRSMEFRELVIAMSDETGEEASPLHDAVAIDREAARLRKRFERVKDRLRTLAELEGLI